LTEETVAENSTESARPREKDLFRRPEFIYSAALFALAATVVSILIVRAGGVLTDHPPLIALFFILYG
jgi:hypothetical protein